MQPLVSMFLGTALISGAMIPIQAGMNATLSRHAGHPLWATAVSLGVSALFVAAVLVALRPAWPSSAALLQSPWWVWFGGLAGAVYITAALILAPKLGAAVFLSGAVAGQMFAAILLDHYGLVGFPERVITPLRVLGAAMVIGGVFVIQLGPRGMEPPANSNNDVAVTRQESSQ